MLAVMTVSAHATFDEIQIEAPGPEGPLQGSLLLPDVDDAPVVLIIPGSGPTDRDGNNPLGVKASTYRLLAEGLARNGIASVRIDKRGMFGSAGAVADPNAVTLNDYANDIHAWIATIRQRTGRDCIWLLGHSEGGTVAMLAAAEGDAICGVIVVATPGRPYGDVIREQLRANPANAPILDEAFDAITRLEAGERVDTAAMHRALLPLFADEIQGSSSTCSATTPPPLLRYCTSRSSFCRARAISRQRPRTPNGWALPTSRRRSSCSTTPTMS